MALYLLNIKETEFKVAVVADPAKMKEGLSGKPALGRSKGLLFNFPSSQTVTMNMKNMNYPLDMIFINDDCEVITVRTLLPGNFQTTVKDVKYVLEVNSGEGSGFVGEKAVFSKELSSALGIATEVEEEESEETKEEEKAEETTSHKGFNIIVRITSSPEKDKELFKKGGKFKMLEDQVKADKNAMQVLDDGGKILMNIVGGERIFSIVHTEAIVALAKKVDRGEAEPEELGKLMSKIIHIQNTQEPQYV